MSATAAPPVHSSKRYDAVLFDLLTAVIDSWTLWNEVAGNTNTGRRWREQYLRLTYGAGAYLPYESLVAQAASEQGLPPALAKQLAKRWGQLRPWPEAPDVLTMIAATTRIGVVTNCSNALGRQAAELVQAPFEVIVTAETAGAYKPRPEPYRYALDALGLAPDRVLFVAGSRHDIPGAGGVGMDVWWHNRIGMPTDTANVPLAEQRSLDSLPDFLTGASTHDQRPVRPDVDNYPAREGRQ
jgi:2-haloacid dehalogenase